MADAVLSNTIWCDEIDAGWIKLLSSTLVNLSTGSPISVLVRKADEDFNPQSYPCATVQSLYQRFSTDRYNPEDDIISKDTLAGKAIVEKSAKPYDLTYQVDFWSKYQSEMNDMQIKWLSSFPRDFNLPVKTRGGVDASCHVMLRGTIRRQDIISSVNRTFRSTMTFNVFGQIDERISSETNLATNITINTTTI